MVSTILTVLGWAFTACIGAIGMLMVCWTVTVAIRALHDKLTIAGFAMLGGAGVSAAITAFLCLGMLRDINAWLPIYHATGVF